MATIVEIMLWPFFWEHLIGLVSPAGLVGKECFLVLTHLVLGGRGAQLIRIVDIV